MNSLEELKTLRHLSNLLMDEKREMSNQTWRRKLIYTAAFIAMVAAFMPFVMQAELLGLAAAAVAALAGALAGFTIYSGLAARQWSAIKPHINHRSVAARIEELDA
jgi:hypothetical protein